MADVDNVSLEAEAPKEEKIVKLRPTLFIGVGGTGLEVMLRVRRRILNAVWGRREEPVRLDSLADFPVAQFMHLDLDQAALLDTGKSETTDLLAELVKLDDDDRIVETFDIEKYCRSDEDLARFPHIASWSPLTPRRIRELGIDPSKGAGQIRGIARLYFFDKYTKIRDKVRTKLNSLRDGLTKRDQFERLALDLERGQFRIVMIGSVAGGTGGGTFIDMGWLAGWIANSAVTEASVELVLFLPTGYASANKDRTEANGYASLMELETCMRSGANTGFVDRWDPFEQKPDKLRDLPYGEVYLVDSGNLAQLHTADQKDVYDMVADALFEDFNSADFANKKRAVAVNQRLHKATPFNAAVPEGLYGDMKLSYYKGYSAFGQSILDTQGEVKRDIRSHRWTAAMLKAFFGVASGDVGNRATDKQRDEFMTAHMYLAAQPFSEFPDFSAKEAKQALTQGEFYDHEITDKLLVDRAGATVASLQQRVDAEIEAIASGFDRTQWPAQVDECLRRLEKDAVRDHTSTADVTEDRISHRRQELLTEISVDVRDRLYNYLDNKEYGGLEFVLSLVEQIKTRLEDPATGLIQRLTTNAGRYQQIKDALRAYEFDRLMGNLRQTMGGGLLNSGLMGSRDKQARAILDQIKVEIGNYLKFHLRSKAAAEAAELLRGLSRWLGDRIDMDAAGNARWSGLVGELQAGRQAVLSMLGDIDKRVALLNDDMKKEHATYMRIDAPEQDVPLPPPARLREWADEAFKGIGGSRRLFPMLSNPAERVKLFSALRHMADSRMPRAQVNQASDPLVDALKALPAAERQRRFSDLLNRAMPWIDANLEREYRPSADQYRCYLGVSNARDWDGNPLGIELLAQVPTSAGITSQQVSFFTTGIRGRIVCYSELSGIPLAVLRGMDAWRTSYQKEKEVIPVHTVRDPTKFTHPRVPTMGELAQLADDFKTFLLGVMLRVLTRVPNSARVSPPGQYQFMVGPGDDRRMGNERAFRQNGLPYNFRHHIHEAVFAKVDVLDKAQLGALAALATFYASGVYTAQLVPTETGAEIASTGFASAIATRLAGELKDRARRAGATDAELERIAKDALPVLDKWTQGVPDSNTDAYDWEVRDVREGEDPRLKRIVRTEFFTPGWFEGSVLNGQPPAAGAGAAIGAPPLAGGTPPPPPPGFGYHLVLQPGVPSGPYPAAHVQHWIRSGQITQETLTWRAGLAGWTPLSEVPELKSFIAATPPPLPNAGPPPIPPPKVGD